MKKTKKWLSLIPSCLLLFAVTSCVLAQGTYNGEKTKTAGAAVAAGQHKGELVYEISTQSSSAIFSKIDVSISQHAIGHNTTDAILSGVIRGTACMVDGLVAQCEKELGEKATIVATGGYCGLIANYLTRSFDYTNPILTLEGLKKIYELNTVPKASMTSSSVVNSVK